MAKIGGYSILDLSGFGALVSGTRLSVNRSDILNFQNRNKPIYVQGLTIDTGDGADITLNQFGERVTIDGQEQLLLHEGAVSLVLADPVITLTFNLG